MNKPRYCKRCGHKVRRETHKPLKFEYPFDCPYCQENMFYFETFKKNQIPKVNLVIEGIKKLNKQEKGKE